MNRIRMSFIRLIEKGNYTIREQDGVPPKLVRHDPDSEEPARQRAVQYGSHLTSL